MCTRIASWSMWGLSLALLGGGLVLTWLKPLHAQFRHRDPVRCPVLASVGDSTVGALIAARRSDNAIGWIFRVMAVGFAGTMFSEEYAVRAIAFPPLVARGRLDRLSGRVAIALGERPHHLGVRHPGRCNGRIDLVELRIADFSVDLCCRRVGKFANWPARRDRLSVDPESQNHRTPVPVSQERLATSPLGTQGRSRSARRIGLVRVHERWRS